MSLQGRDVSELARDYLMLAGKLDQVPKLLARRAASYQRFVQREGHNLRRFPGALASMAAAQPAESAVRGDAERPNFAWTGVLAAMLTIMPFRFLNVIALVRFPFAFAVHAFARVWILARLGAFLAG